jgi:hypothetical protein
MSLSLTASFANKTNSVLILALNSGKQGAALRVASNGTDTLGTLTAVGAQAESLTWAISQNPDWVSIVEDASSQSLVIKFENAQAQTYPYQFYVTCTDGVTTTYFPITLDVKDPLSLKATTGSSTLSIASYDSSVADVVVQGLGLNGVVESGIRFVTPLALPSGMNFVTQDGSQLVLRVADSSSTNLSGGLSLYTNSPTTTSFTIQAYRPGSMYDTPERCATQEFILESLSAKQAVVNVSLSVSYDNTAHVLTLNGYADFLRGRTIPCTYEWVVGGSATGTITSGGSAADTTMTWVPTSNGLVQFTFRVKNASTGAVLGQVTWAPVITGSNAGIPVSLSGTWTSTSAAKIAVSTPVIRNTVGGQVAVTVSTPAAELSAGETFTVTLVSSTATGTTNPLTLSTSTVTLNAANPSATVQATIPSSGLNEKWMISASAKNDPANPTRTGFATATIESNGMPSMAVTTTSGNALTSLTGNSINVALQATSGGSAVNGVTFSLLGAPDGLVISGSSLIGNALKPGAYTFKVIAEAIGYQRSYSATITLTVSQGSIPLTITDPSSSLTALPDGQSYNISWGFTGTPTELNLEQNFTVRNMLGVTQTALSQLGSSVIAIFGTSYYGPAYSVPTLVLSSSIATLGNLLNSPTIGVIDEANGLTLNWQPPTVNGGYQAYKGFNIWLSAPNATPVAQSVAGRIPTGLEPTGATTDSRLFVKTLDAGDWVVDMQALTSDTSVAQNATHWDQPHQFPTALASSQVTADNQAVSMGQSVTFTLDSAYSGADSWCAFYPDGTNSGWLPLSIRSIAKAFTTPGTTPVIIQTQRDYSKSNPGVKLRRQITVTLYVMDQQYNATNQDSNFTGDLGLGGNSGFEVVGTGKGASATNYDVTDASTGQVTLQPYEVVVRALVRDTMTNELKMMVATSRTSDASSLLGTMALDVFPILGRPRIKDLVNPAMYLTPEAVKSGNPVRIATSALPNVIVGKPMNDFLFQVASNSGVGPFSWYADELPAGLRLSVNGTLSGVPTQMGTTSVNVVVVDSNSPPFIAEKTFDILVETDLKITTDSLPVAVVGTSYNTALQQTGGLPPYTWEIVSGEQPKGIVVDENTGVLGGTPVTYNSTSDFSKTFKFTVQVRDAIGAVASKQLSCTLSPATLTFGDLDQSRVFANESFKLRVPVMGGRAPYTLSAFTDDGAIDSGLSIANPDRISVVAGVNQALLQVTTTDQQSFPQNYPAVPSFVLAATGGSAPYRYSLGAFTTLPGAAIYGDLMLCTPTVDGNYSAEIVVTDSFGQTASKIINVLIQKKDSGVYTIKPVLVNLNGSSNPSAWTVTQIPALPDAQNSQPYYPGPGSYYGLALYQSTVLHLSQNSGTSDEINFTVRSGSLPTGIVAFSGTAIANNGTDYSGIVLFNISGGQNATVNGQYSFEAEFSNIRAQDGTTVQAVTRASITVTTSGGDTTPVVEVVSDTGDPQEVNLAQVTNGWYYPLMAEGGSGPYTFRIESGTTLPGATIVGFNGMYAITSTSAGTGNYTVLVTAADVYGVRSTVASIPINLTKTESQPINIVGSNIPAYLYAGRAIPPNTYFIETDLPAAFTATGLPPGIIFSALTGTRGYISGTPTVSGAYALTLKATSLSYGTSATKSMNLEIRNRTANFINLPSKAVISTDYRVVNNNAIIFVQYTGYQPTDSDLPLPTSHSGTLGSPSTTNGGAPTTGILSLTADGFVMSFDYRNDVLADDILTIGSTTVTVPIAYQTLVAQPRSIPASVSEYSTTGTFAAPVTISGGKAPYSVAYVGFSDPRFTASGTQIVIQTANFTPGTTVSCSVSMLVTDASGQSVSVVGTLVVTIRQETYITAIFSDDTWAVNVSGGQAFTSSFVPNSTQSVPLLGHSPYQFYVDAVTLPSGLGSFVQVSPTKRVLAIAFNNTSTSASIPDRGTTLASSGSFTVGATSSAAAPAPGVYNIGLTLRVVDVQGYSISGNVNLKVVIS